MAVRGLVRICVVLALAVACFRQLQPIQMMKQAQIDCVATAMDMTADAVSLMLLGAAQASMSFAAAAAPSRFYISLSLFLGPLTALKLVAVLAGVVHLAVGRCYGHGGNNQLLVGVFVTFGLLCLAGLVVSFFSITVTLRRGV